MSAREKPSWAAKNQRALAQALKRIHGLVEVWLEPGQERKADSRAAAPAALESLCAAFNLSAFERDVLLLCAAPELEARFGVLLGKANGDPHRVTPTFSIALAALPEAHWSALTPTAPLRRWRLVDVGAGESLATSPLRIDERVLHFLAGVATTDERVESLVRDVPAPKMLPESHQRAVERIIAVLRKSGDRPGGPPVIRLAGEHGSQRGVAAVAAVALGLRLSALRARDIPAAGGERETLARLLEREAVLGRRALLIEIGDAEPAETARAAAFAETVESVIFLAGSETLGGTTRECVRIELAPPAILERQTLWRSALGPLADSLNGTLKPVARQFQFGAAEIADAASRMRAEPGTDGKEAARLWGICRATARPGLDALAQRIEPAARWDDLVLPPTPMRALREIAAQVRQRFRVYETWGFAAKSSRGLGIAALFTGASGTGKTMAAEVLAADLELDLYRIDLSAVVSKYIGETEKNLRRVFDAAERGGAILLFDEADALFGKRSEVKDSHDRYANIEVGYLLQRMEAYRGLAILTANSKASLDASFLRRLRFVIDFPFPDVAQRVEIWRRIFPSATPTESLRLDVLAKLSVAGGNIRNIALHAAFLAADAGEPVRMRHLADAARAECAKLERSQAEQEIAGWI